MFARFVRLSLVVVLVAVIASFLAQPAYALSGSLSTEYSGSKPVCTASSTWIEKLFGMCNDIKVKPAGGSPVSTQPAIDTAKWEKALADAEAYLRSKASDNADPVDSSNPVLDTAYKYYCGDGEPKFDALNQPICQ